MVTFNPSVNPYNEPPDYFLFPELIFDSTTPERALQILSVAPNNPVMRQWVVENARRLVIRFHIAELPAWINLPRDAFRYEYLSFTPEALLDELSKDYPDAQLLESLNGESYRDNEGQTAFHSACKWDHGDKFLLIGKLIQYGWKSYSVDNNGDYPFDLLQRHECTDLIRALALYHHPEEIKNWVYPLCLLKDLHFATCYLSRTCDTSSSDDVLIEDFPPVPLRILTGVCNNSNDINTLITHLNDASDSVSDERVWEIIKFILLIFKIPDEDDRDAYDDILIHFTTAYFHIGTTANENRVLIQACKLITLIQHCGDKREQEYFLELLYDHFEKKLLGLQIIHQISVNYLNTFFNSLDAPVPEKLQLMIASTHTLLYMDTPYYTNMSCDSTINYLDIVLPGSSPKKALLTHINHLKKCSSRLNKYIIAKCETTINPILPNIEILSNEWNSIISRWLQVGGQLDEVNLFFKLDFQCGRTCEIINNAQELLRKTPQIKPFLHKIFARSNFNTKKIQDATTALAFLEFSTELGNELSPHDFNYQNYLNLPVIKKIFNQIGYFIPNDIKCFESKQIKINTIRNYLNDVTNETFVDLKERKLTTSTIFGVRLNTFFTSEKFRKTTTLQIGITARFADKIRTVYGFFTKSGYEIYRNKFALAMVQNMSINLLTDRSLRYIHQIFRKNFNEKLVLEYSNTTRNTLPIKIKITKNFDSCVIETKHFDFQHQNVLNSYLLDIPLSNQGLVFGIKHHVDNLLETYYHCNINHIKKFQQDLMEVFPLSCGNPSLIKFDFKKGLWLEHVVAKELRRPETLFLIGTKLFPEKDFLDALKSIPEIEEEIFSLEAQITEMISALKLLKETRIWNCYLEAQSPLSSFVDQEFVENSRKRVWIFDSADPNKSQKHFINNRVPSMFAKKMTSHPIIKEILDLTNKLIATEESVYERLITHAVNRGFLTSESGKLDYQRTVKGVLWHLKNKSVIRMIAPPTLLPITPIPVACSSNWGLNEQS